MASIKRKSGTEIRNGQPEKKHKFGTMPESGLSVLRNEEPAFPRGGATILTPLEHKQIQIQATRDVLFEQNAAGKSSNRDLENEENEEDTLDGVEEIPVAIRQNPKPKTRKGKGLRILEEPGLRIEGLSYKVG